MMLLRTRALQLGISEQEYADRRDNYTSQFDADPSYCLKIARMALRRQAMQELGFGAPMADVETRQAEYLSRAVSAAGCHHHFGRCGGHGRRPGWRWNWAADISTGRATKDGTPGLVYYFTQENDPHIVLSPAAGISGCRPGKHRYHAANGRHPGADAMVRRPSGRAGQPPRMPSVAGGVRPHTKLPRKATPT